MMAGRNGNKTELDFGKSRELRSGIILLALLLIQSSPPASIAQEEADSPSDIKSEQQTTNKQNSETQNSGPFKAVDLLLKEGRFKEARSELEKLSIKFKEKHQTEDLIRAFERLSIAQRHLGEFIEAERTLKFALGMCKPGEEDKDGNSTKARVLFHLSDILDQAGQYKEAGYIVKQGTTAVRHLSIAGSLPYLETELVNIDARMLVTQGDLSKAEELVSEALYMVNALPEKPEEFCLPGSSLSASKAYLKGKVLSTQTLLKESEGKIAEADKIAKSAYEIFSTDTKTALKDPRSARLLFRFSPERAKLKADLGEDNELSKAALLEIEAREKRDKNDLDGALASLQEAYKIRSANLEPASAIIGNTMVGLADLNIRKNKFADAVSLATKGYEILARTVDQTSPWIAEATSTLGRAHMGLGATEGVEPLLTHAWNIEAKRLGKDSPAVLDIMQSLSELYLMQKNYVKAIQVGAPVTTAREKAYGSTSLELVPTLTSTGTAYARLKKYDIAKGLLNRAKSILEANGRAKTSVYGDVLAAIGVNETLHYRWTQGKVSLQKAIDLYEGLYGANNRKTISMKLLYRQMSKHRTTIPGAKNVLMQGGFKPQAPDSF